MSATSMAMQELGFSLRRIFAIVLRHLYLLKRSWPRILELMYWPTVQLILWGFITLFLATNSSFIANATGILLSAVLLWDVLFRGQLGVSLIFMEEIWSRNLAHLFVSPLRPWELISSLLTMSLIRTLIGVGGASLIAIPLFDFSVYTLGWPLVAFFINLLILGWSIGLIVSGIVLRYGLGAESIAWISVFAIQPISGVYYPISVLPEWLQKVAFVLPSSHVFEGMRSVIIDHVFRTDLLFWAIITNLGWLAVGVITFLLFFRAARIRGQILNLGE
ncbi:MAG: ABC transporter permease [Gammaproteobacteria bacterium]|nr:MAG: ABC transporter permease [Gammaproteobacteria bacterium]